MRSGKLRLTTYSSLIFRTTPYRKIDSLRNYAENSYVRVVGKSLAQKVRNPKAPQFPAELSEYIEN
ncbi:hypothetical protein PATSB16_05540 [Pandoraea thiooxydans]|nr:hypothetical protein PATSB16_05540 [Pandoraea thiooxydans]